MKNYLLKKALEIITEVQEEDRVLDEDEIREVKRLIEEFLDY